MSTYMRIFFAVSIFSLSLFCPLLAETPALIDGLDPKVQANINLAQLETEAWLLGLDQGNYGGSWDQGSLMFRNTIKRAEWIKAMNESRKPKGKVALRAILDIRTAKNPKGLAPGDYMVFFYKTSFADKKEALELVTLVQETNGAWKILTYEIQ